MVHTDPEDRNPRKLTLGLRINCSQPAATA